MNRIKGKEYFKEGDIISFFTYANDNNKNEILDGKVIEVVELPYVEGISEQSSAYLIEPLTPFEDFKTIYRTHDELPEQNK